MAEYINRDELLAQYTGNILAAKVDYAEGMRDVIQDIKNAPVADVAPVVHGRWILEAHKERANYRWNVTAECSECCDEIKEIWAGFFPNVPDCIARDVSLISAKEVELSNYCPNCGAKMDLDDE